MTSQQMSALIHTPVLLQETLDALAVKPGGRYIDCTLGGGGHAFAILEHSSPGGQLLGIDADPKAIEEASKRLETYSDSCLLVCDNFINLQAICLKYDFFPVHGILFDLGLSALQLNDYERGFSFQHDAPLDMRLNPTQEVTAAILLNSLHEAELANILSVYGEESHSHRIAHQIVLERPIRTTAQLVRVIDQTTGGKRGRIHPATKTFQALRIAVNYELEHLQAALRQSVSLLGIDGRLVVISYHSLEDRIVKQFMLQESRDCICPPSRPTCTCGHKASLRLISRKVITPFPSEVQSNPRSRSAKLRVAERIVTQEERDKLIENICSSVATNGWRRPALLKRLQKAFATA